MKKDSEFCTKCSLYGRVADAPTTVKEDCLYHLDPDLDNNGNIIDTPPCEREGK